jgi:coenzyme F420-0:L-glutamate ligase/coenzyme F420-1:gamma-L-glutamate ligase
VSIDVVPIHGLPEINEGDDLAALIAEAGAGLEDGDVVVVTQKAVSKAEGRVVPEGDGKDAWVGAEMKRVVASRGELVIAETRHGFVCANAGVDLSNVAPGSVSLLPEDPDASAEGIRAGLRRHTGRDVAVVVTDTFGRPWRRGLVEVAIGCAGLPPLLDLRGTKDRYGRLLTSTVVAVADEIAAGAGLVMGKADGVPVAIVRGLGPMGPPGPARDLVRTAEEDLFRTAPLTAISTRRSVRAFAPGPVPREALIEAVAAALTAPVPHGSRHPRRPWTWSLLDRGGPRGGLLEAMAEAWARDLRADGVPEEVIARRRRRSDELLGAAPVLAVPAVSLEHADVYPDERRRRAERDMFVLATGAAVQSFMLALHVLGLASCWVSSTLFCSPEAAEALGLDQGWLPMGAVAVGRPIEEARERPPTDTGAHIMWG